VKKRCKDCGELKNIGWFYRQACYRDGHMNICKVCKRRQVAENRELKAEYYRQKKREIDARPYYVQQRAAYSRSDRGRQVHRAACGRYRRFKALEMRA
jgi:hypothetical protein